MPIRKRISIPLPTVNAGGGAPPTVANLQVGPDFGENAGSDDNTFTVSSAMDLDAVDLTGFFAVQNAISLDSVDLEGNLGVGVGVDLESLDLEGNLGVNAALTTQLTVVDKLADEDTYLDENAPDTTFGSATDLLSKTNAALGQNEQTTYLAWDFTWLQGSVDSAVIEMTSRTSAVLGENANISIQTSPSKPIEEDTATWNNSEPPSGTQRQTHSEALTTTNKTFTITLNATARANMPGNWIFLRIPGTSALGLNTITTESKETGTASLRPTMDYTVTL